MNKISKSKPKPLQSTYADNEIDSEIKFMSTGSNNQLLKGGLISERFSLWLLSSKKCAKCYPEGLIFRLIEVRIVIWHLFWEIGAKVEKLSEIEPPLASFTSYNFMENIICFLSLDKIISQLHQIGKFSQHIKIPKNHYTLIWSISVCCLSC